MTLQSSRQGNGTVNQNGEQETVLTAPASIPMGATQQNVTGVRSQVVTFLFVRIDEIPGSEPEAKTVADELAAYRQLIEEVGNTYQGITRMLNASSALLLFPARSVAAAPSRQGIDAAVALRQRLEALNRQRLGEQRIPFRIGIGVHTDTLVPFTVNEKQRLTALQASIQDAEGLSLLNWQAPFPAIFVSKNAFRGLGDSNGYNVQSLGEVSAPNQAKALAVFALM